MFIILLGVFGQWDSEAAQRELQLTPRLEWLNKIPKKQVFTVEPFIPIGSKEAITNTPGYGVKIWGKNLNAYCGQRRPSGEEVRVLLWEPTSDASNADAQFVGEYSTKDDLLTGLDIFYKIGSASGYILKDGTVSGDITSVDELRSILPDREAMIRKIALEAIHSVLDYTMKYESKEDKERRMGKYFFTKQEYEPIQEKLVRLAGEDTDKVIASIEAFAQELYRKHDWRAKFELEEAIVLWSPPKKEV